VNIYIALYYYEISNAIHALCQCAANRKHLRQRLKKSKVRSLRNAGTLFHADEPAQENALLPAAPRYDELSMVTWSAALASRGRGAKEGQLPPNRPWTRFWDSCKSDEKC